MSEQTKIELLVKVEGAINGGPGDVVECGAGEAEGLIRRKLAKPCEDKPKRTRKPKPEAEAETEEG